MRCQSLLTATVMFAGCHTTRSNPATVPEVASSRYLFVWAGDADKRESDFLAVVDVDRQSPTRYLTGSPSNRSGIVW